MEQKEADNIMQSSRLSPQTEEEIRNHIELLKDELAGIEKEIIQKQGIAQGIRKGLAALSCLLPD